MTFAGVPRGKQQSERLGWGAGNVPKPINAFKPQKQTSVWESGWEQETPSSNPNQSPGLSGALIWELPRDVPKAPIPYWILSLASQASNILCSRQHFWKSWGGREFTVSTAHTGIPEQFQHCCPCQQHSMAPTAAGLLGSTPLQNSQQFY